MDKLGGSLPIWWAKVEKAHSFLSQKCCWSPCPVLDTVEGHCGAVTALTRVVEEGRPFSRNPSPSQRAWAIW